MKRASHAHAAWMRRGSCWSRAGEVRRTHAPVRGLVDASGRRMKHPKQPVPDELQGVLRPHIPLQNADEGSGVPAVDRTPQLGPLLPMAHSHILLAARRLPQYMTDMNVSRAK